MLQSALIHIKPHILQAQEQAFMSWRCDVKKSILLTAVVLGLCGVAQASAAVRGDIRYADLEQVQQIRILGSLDGWRRVDDHSIIVWATPFRPYLIELSRRSPDLRFTNIIGVTSTIGTVHERFDSVIVDGLRYPIKAIYKMDRQSARDIKSIS